MCKKKVRNFSGFLELPSSIIQQNGWNLWNTDWEAIVCRVITALLKLTEILPEIWNSGQFMPVNI